MGEKGYGLTLYSIMVLQTIWLSSYIAFLVWETPRPAGEAVTEFSPNFLASEWPKEPPPWTATTLSPEEAISSARAETTSDLKE
jgi:hypothetical protein